MTVLIKRYANRKLYNTRTSRYITLKGIAELIEVGEDIRVIDNESGEDITSITLSQILVDTERSNRSVPGNLLWFFPASMAGPNGAAQPSIPEKELFSSTAMISHGPERWWRAPTAWE